MHDQQTIYVDSPQRLEEAVAHLSVQPDIGVDLEFDKNRYRYGFNLCLLQISSASRCYLVDPIAEGLDISSLFPILENPEVIKTVFSFREDLSLLHTLGCRPKGLYDIGLAIRLMDRGQTSLGNIIEEYLDVQLDKGEQSSNWIKRPLTASQLDYATRDVIYLLELKEKVMAEIGDKDVKDWVDEENRFLEESDFSISEIGPAIKEKEKKDMNQVQWHCYTALMHYREELAETLDLPPGRVMRTDYVKEIIVSGGLRYWDKHRGTHNRVRKPKYKKEIMDLIHASESEALDQGLSKEKGARERLSREDYQRHRDHRRDKEWYLEFVARPIQKELKKRFGEETAIFLLSNRVAADIFSIQDLKIPAYRRGLFAAARDLVTFGEKEAETYERTIGRL